VCKTRTLTLLGNTCLGGYYLMNDDVDELLSNVYNLNKYLELSLFGNKYL